MNRTTLFVAAACSMSLFVISTHVCSQDTYDSSPFRRALPTTSPPAAKANRATRPAGTTGRGMVDEDEDKMGGRPASMMGGGRAAMMGGGPLGGMRTQGPTRRRVVTETARIERVIEVPVSEEELQAMKEFQNALDILKDSTDDAARKKASEAIEAQLVKQFNQDLKQREEELAAVEQRVTSLRQQLEKRKASQAEIISLRLKTIINNVDGLGFPGDPGAVDPSFIFSDPAEGKRISDEMKTLEFHPAPARRNQPGPEVDTSLYREVR